MAVRALPGRLFLSSRARTPVSLHARTRELSTSPSGGAAAGGSRRLFTLRRLAAVGLVSAVGAGTWVFVQDAREGARELDALNARNPVGATAKRERKLAPLGDLVRTYVVYTFCSFPRFVDWAPTILATCFAVPGLRQLTEAAIRVTFFGQFTGGDSAEEALPLIEELREQNTGCLFAYSVEVDEGEAQGHGSETGKAVTSVHKQIVAETLHCVDVAADYEDKHSTGLTGRRTWVAIKLSAMVPDAESLRRLSQYLVDTRPRIGSPVAFPGCPLPTDLDVLSSRSATGPLTESDIVVLRELRADLDAICTRAQERNVRIIFDAEYSWYEPAIDAYTLDMMRKFNKLPTKATAAQKQSVQPLIYATYQAYLRRTPEYIAQSIAAARQGGYALGVKLVRGAYHPHETAAHPHGQSSSSSSSSASASSSSSLSISPDAAPPVWAEKRETDGTYDGCVRALLASVKADVQAQRKSQSQPTIGVLFGTHNWTSADLIVDELARQGLGKLGADGVVEVGDAVAERVTVGQLFGMTAALTNYLVDRTRSSSPFVIKYIPYGRLAEVMPYLSRRAIENKSVLGNGAAQEERRRAAAEIVARVFG